MPHYAWKGLQGDKYATVRVEAINREEAAFKVKQDKVIITSLTRISGDRSEDLNLDLIKESNESTIFVGFIFSWE